MHVQKWAESLDLSRVSEAMTLLTSLNLTAKDFESQIVGTEPFPASPELSGYAKFCLFSFRCLPPVTQSDLASDWLMQLGNVQPFLVDGIAYHFVAPIGDFGLKKKWARELQYLSKKTNYLPFIETLNLRFVGPASE